MLKFLRNKVHPIGIDLGSDSLKMMQLATTDRGFSLVAAAKAQVPYDVRGNGSAMQEWYVKQIRTLLGAKPFKGKKVVTCLPARDLIIQHLRMARMENEQLAQALVFEAQDKVPFNCRHALLRHMVAGEIYEGSETRLEVILMAASRATVEQHLRLLERIKMETECVHVEPQALIGGFTPMLQHAGEQDNATMFIDLGHGFTKVAICHGPTVAFCRNIHLGTEHLHQELARQMGMSLDRAAELLAGLYRRESQEGGLSTAAYPASSATSVAAPPLMELVGGKIQGLCEEIRGCLRYHDLLFNAQRVARVIFLGGLAKNTPLCQDIAKRINLPAQLGDPLARLEANSKYGPHSDLEPEERHCEWAVAFGLSLGSTWQTH